jgi:hypothetical protein
MKRPLSNGLAVFLSERGDPLAERWSEKNRARERERESEGERERDYSLSRAVFFSVSLARSLSLPCFRSLTFSSCPSPSVTLSLARAGPPLSETVYVYCVCKVCVYCMCALNVVMYNAGGKELFGFIESLVKFRRQHPALVIGAHQPLYHQVRER